MKRILSFVLISVLCLGIFTGCSQNETQKTGWEYIEEKGELIIGLDDTFAPMGFRDENNQLVGFDIDLANAVGEVLGVNIKFQPIDWDGKDFELESKNIDCIWNGMSATPERQEEMALSKKYLHNQISVMAIKEKNVTVDTIDELKDKKIVTQQKSAALETMQAHPDYESFKDNVSEFPTYDQCILELRTGRADVMVVDRTLGEYKNQQLDFILDFCGLNFGDDYYAIGFRKEDTDLADKVNSALEELIDNGKAAEISEKWFNENIVILEGY